MRRYFGGVFLENNGSEENQMTSHEEFESQIKDIYQQFFENSNTQDLEEIQIQSFIAHLVDSQKSKKIPCFKQNQKTIKLFDDVVKKFSKRKF